MDRLITSTPPGGFPLVLDDLRWFLGQVGQSESIYQALDNLLRLFGDNFVVQGIVISGSSPNFQITEGWIILDGELLKVDAQTNIDTATDGFFNKVITFDPAGDKKAQNGSDIRAYQINRGVVSGLTGSLAFGGVRYEDLIIPAIRDRLNSIATQIQSGLIEIATQAETLAGIDPTRALTPFSINTRLPLVQKVVEIGDWDMHFSSPGDGITSVNVAHGLSLAKIRSVDCVIRNDTDNVYFKIDKSVSSDASSEKSHGTIQSITATVVELTILIGGDFDSTAFDTDTGFNRGWITIWHTL